MSCGYPHLIHLECEMALAELRRMKVSDVDWRLITGKRVITYRSRPSTQAELELRSP